MHAGRSDSWHSLDTVKLQYMREGFPEQSELPLKVPEVIVLTKFMPSLPGLAKRENFHGRAILVRFIHVKLQPVYAFANTTQVFEREDHPSCVISLC